ncbi:MAG TPA: AbrB/MazE/SpoVT family DNA-binding domain-containing protein [Thermoanaerobaculia bacterium]|jgi:AbrB family looped-hinge helix DNA binding protein|nr:AbrB/MazE/SpoVT family DNA-binding domain-containing protein [Thermoanaerobaculia bacterium]
MPKATLTSKGQVTIPKEIRQRLGLRQGDQLMFRFDERGTLTVEPAAPNLLGDLPGLLCHRAGKRPATIAEMDEAVRERAGKRFLRATRR